MRKKISIKLALQTERQEVKQLEHILKVKIIGGSKGAAEIRPPGSKLFYFHAVFGTKICKIIGLWELAPLSGKSWIRHCSYFCISAHSRCIDQWYTV